MLQGRSLTMDKMLTRLGQPYLPPGKPIPLSLRLCAGTKAIVLVPAHAKMAKFA
jgi:hypothetical protein